MTGPADSNIFGAPPEQEVYRRARSVADAARRWSVSEQRVGLQFAQR